MHAVWPICMSLTPSWAMSLDIVVLFGHCVGCKEQSSEKLCCMQVRRLICACLVQLYLVGDTLPLYSRVASLQSYLGSKVRGALIILALSPSSYNDMPFWAWLFC